MVGERNAKPYRRMLKYNLWKKSCFNNIHAQQTPSSNYFQTDESANDTDIIMNYRQRLKLIKNPTYLRKMGIPMKNITPANVLFPLSQADNRYYY